VVSLANLMPESHRAAIAQIPGVELVAPHHWFGGRLKGHERDFFANFAVEGETFERIWSEYRVRADLLAAWKRDLRGAIVGKKLLERFGWHVGQRITLIGDIYAGCDPELTILATYEGGQDAETLFFHRKALQEMLRGTRAFGMVPTFYVVLRDASLASKVCRAIDTRFISSEAPTRSETEKDFFLAFVALIGDVRTIVRRVTFVVLGAVFLVVANTMAMAVRERTREVAIMKALGFEPGIVIALIAGEGVAVGLAGWLVGCVGARVLFDQVLGRPTVMQFFPDFVPSWATVVTGLPIALGIGLLSALGPAALAARIEVVAGLRRVS
jgi:putative ABC transport system permease protein